MSTDKHSTVINAPPEAVFALLHDYDRRLEWDTLLKEARLLDGADQAGPGVKTRCVGRNHLLAAAVEARYVTYKPPRVAAVSMTRGPWFFATFAATIRHEPISDDASSVSYHYHFQARPRWLRWLLNPLVCAILSWETKRRLAALKRAAELAEAGRQPAASPKDVNLRRTTWVG